MSERLLNELDASRRLVSFDPCGVSPRACAATSSFSNLSLINFRNYAHELFLSAATRLKSVHEFPPARVIALQVTLQPCFLVALMPCVMGQVTSTLPEPGSIAGVVLNDLTGQPLKRAQVVLRPAQSGLTAFSQSTGVDGAFSFPRVAPCRYSILRQRDGSLPAPSGFLCQYRL